MRAPEREVAVRRPAERLGFFTDTTVCIGCKACEVACKQWNDLPADGQRLRRGGSYDHTGALGATSWRHVRFVEKLAPSPAARAEAEAALAAGSGGHVPEIPAVAELESAGAGAQPEEMPDLVAWAQERNGESSPADPARALALMDRWIFTSDVCKH